MTADSEPLDSASTQPSRGWGRREFLAAMSGLGFGATAFSNALFGVRQGAPRVTVAMIEQAEKIAGLNFTDSQRKLMERGVNRRLLEIEELRKTPLSNLVPPCASFDPVPPGRARPVAAPRLPSTYKPVKAIEAPGDLEELAFQPLAQLSELVRTRAVTSTELTEMYLARLERFDPKLLCVVNLTRELALAQAKQADAEIAAGKHRGPLHGIPWGAKDLLHTKGLRTTFGAEPYREQVSDVDAAVVEKLRDAGAVLVAKLTLGALAMGDVWFGGMTRNPWKPDQGSSGSSAGPASATAAGLVGFAIGSETNGSIVSPCTRCGATGLRPTFGRVSRWGAMALSWSMDKLGPICRSAVDCALVLDAIHGLDRRDPGTIDLPFRYHATRPLSQLRIGYLKSAFGATADPNDRAALATIRELGVEPAPIELPELPPIDSIGMVLEIEAASAFDDFTRDGAADQLKEQNEGAWPNVFRAARVVPAVEYLRAMRMRTQLLEKMAQLFDTVDVLVTPPYAANLLTITNLTGHPALVLPTGFRKDGTPTSVTFIGKLYGDADVLRLGEAFQGATDFHVRAPEQFLK